MEGAQWRRAGRLPPVSVLIGILLGWLAFEWYSGGAAKFGLLHCLTMALVISGVVLVLRDPAFSLLTNHQPCPAAAASLPTNAEKTHPEEAMSSGRVVLGLPDFSPKSSAVNYVLTAPTSVRNDCKSPGVLTRHSPVDPETLETSLTSLLSMSRKLNLHDLDTALSRLVAAPHHEYQTMTTRGEAVVHGTGQHPSLLGQHSLVGQPSSNLLGQHGLVGQHGVVGQRGLVGQLGRYGGGSSEGTSSSRWPLDDCWRANAPRDELDGSWRRPGENEEAEGGETVPIPSEAIRERLERNDRYALGVPVTELIRFFSQTDNARSIGVFYATLLANVDSLPASTAADLLRLPVKTQQPCLEVSRALCNRLLQIPVEQRNLTSMQIALACWSLARSHKSDWTPMLESLAEEALAKPAEFLPLSIANMFWGCGKLRFKHELMLSRLADAAVQQLENFNAQNIANTYWALGTLECPHTPLTPPVGSAPCSTVVTLLLEKVATFNSQAIANFIWACAKLHWCEGELMAALCMQASDKHREFKPQECANLMWGIAKLGYQKGVPCVELFARKAALNIRSFNCQEVSNAYWALGTLEIKDSALTPASLSLPVVFSGGGNSCSLASGSWFTPSRQELSYSAPATKNPNVLLPAAGGTCTPSTQESIDMPNDTGSRPGSIEWFPEPRQHYTMADRELLTSLLEKMESFNSQAVANFLWACGRLQWKCYEVVTAVRYAVQRNVNSFRPQNTANVLWALAKLKVRDLELVHLLANRAAASLFDFNTQEIANVYWGLGTLEIRDTSLTPAVSWSPEAPVPSVHAGVFRAVKGKLRNFKPQELANFLWACARLRWKPVELLDEARVWAARNVGKFKPQEVGNLVWALAKLNYRQNDLIRAMCENAAQNIATYTPQNVANIYWALGNLTFSQTPLSSDEAPEDFIQSLLPIITRFNTQEITNFVWACGRLRWDNKEVLNTATAVVLQEISRFRRQELLNLQWAFRKLGRHEVAAVLFESFGPSASERTPLRSGGDWPSAYSQNVSGEAPADERKFNEANQPCSPTGRLVVASE